MAVGEGTTKQNPSPNSHITMEEEMKKRNYNMLHSLIVLLALSGLLFSFSQDSFAKRTVKERSAYRQELRDALDEYRLELTPTVKNIHDKQLETHQLLKHISNQIDKQIILLESIDSSLKKKKVR